MTKTLTKTLARALCAGSIAVSLASAAHAAQPREDFEVAFEYSRTAPVAQTHAAFEKTARKACFAAERTALTRPYLRMQRNCQAALVKKAVLETGLPDLIAYHSKATDKPARMTPSAH